MSRGVYGVPFVGADHSERRGHSLVTWLVGGLVVGGAVLWAKHQSDQIQKLSSAAGVPYEGFGQHMRESARALPSRARSTYQDLVGSFRGTKALAGEKP
jgi:hypothetical protein